MTPCVQVMCHEGYKDAVSMLTHSKEVHTELEAMIKKLGKDKVKILCSGPADQLAIIKAKMDGEQIPSHSLVAFCFPIFL